MANKRKVFYISRQGEAALAALPPRSASAFINTAIVRLLKARLEAQARVNAAGLTQEEVASFCRALLNWELGDDVPLSSQDRAVLDTAPALTDELAQALETISLDYYDLDDDLSWVTN